MPKRVTLNHYLSPYRLINSEWIDDLKRTAKPIKPSEENIEVNLHDITFDNGFLD